ncbi:GFA family protein [Aureimonas sp. Leaf324]|uniref:GFA family protein n=1 Tax=Aureimonas sp. Leaf324 TaxID=1736336 RepID=UPI0006FAF03A|nr:GFA family protein [Aureimonas sp. Leaf324]KQQ85795.1 aldehyde-activating protein [Aureimonas sp. Leaf324]
MTLQAEPSHTGGCQCGAVRFRIHGTLGRASVCHCRMCQKAFGGLYAPLVNLGTAEIVWMKREPKRFRSSNHVSRGFCPDCGTPLTYEAPDGMALAIGAFDDPSRLAPQIQFGIEGKLPYVDGISQLPAHTSTDDATDNDYLADIVSFQHPDREMPGEAPGDARHP